MAPVIYRRQTCRLCGSKSLELVFALAPSPIGDAYVLADKVNVPQPTYPIDLFLCRDCGLAQLLDVISPEVLYGDYIYETSSSLGLAQHFERYAADVIARNNIPRGSLIVDVGSNDGTLLGFFKKMGMRVLGVEPAPQIALAANARGIPTMNGLFTLELARQIRAENGAASVITGNNVFANIDELTSPIQGVQSLLANDGLFVCESYYIADVIRNMVFDFIYHEHISSFAVLPLRSFFDRMGLQLIDVLPVPTKGGSLRYTVQLAGAGRHVQPIVDKMVQQEKEMGLYNPQMFRDFTARVWALKDQSVSLLSKATAAGKRIAGFGASITVTTLIYHFGIGSFLEYLVDDNPAKQGRFSPGLHLPVYPSAALYEKKPDVVPILAWRYADPIIAKHQRFLDGGGTFIVPVPQVKVLGKPIE